MLWLFPKVVHSEHTYIFNDGPYCKPKISFSMTLDYDIAINYSCSEAAVFVLAGFVLKFSPNRFTVEFEVAWTWNSSANLGKLVRTLRNSLASDGNDKFCSNLSIPQASQVLLISAQRSLGHIRLLHLFSVELQDTFQPNVADQLIRASFSISQKGST